MHIRSLAVLGIVVLVPLSACPDNEGSSSDAGGGGGADVVSQADAHENGDATTNGDAAADGGVNADAAAGDANAPDAQAMNPPELASGSRLRAIVVSTPEGAKELRGWFDRDRAEECSFATAEDAIERCLPGTYPAPAIFLDDHCTEHGFVFSRVACSTVAPAYAQEIDEYGCNSARTVRALEPAITRPVTTLYQLDAMGMCNGMPNFGGEVHPLGEAIAPASFVGAQRVHGATGPRLTGTYRVGEDGSSERLGWFDETTGENCIAQQATDSMARCTPDIGPYHPVDVWYADAMCTLDAAVAFPSNCVLMTDYAYEPVSAGCETQAKYYELGAVVSSTSTYQRSGPMSCSSAADALAPGGGMLYRIGAEVAADTFPALPIAPAGTVRLRAVTETAPGGATREINAAWFDSVRGEDCRFDRAADGELRCLPSGLSNELFEDEECMQPLAADVITPECATTPTLATIYEVDACDVRKHVYALGDMVMPAQIYFAFDGMCLPAATGLNIFYRLGAEIAATEFVLGTAMTE